MIESSKVHKILYGGDYNPEQWPEEIWKEDMRLFKLAHIDVVTLNVFSWAALQPDEITYDFSKLDKIMEYVDLSCELKEYDAVSLTLGKIPGYPACRA